MSSEHSDIGCFSTHAPNDENEFWHKFLSTPEAVESFALTDAVESELGTSCGTVTVPADFLRHTID